MATLRESIVENVGQVLAGIRRSNGYRTDVLRVEPYGRGSEDAKLGELPYVGYYVKSQQDRDELFGQRRCTLLMELVAHLAVEEDQRAAAIYDLTADLRKALYADPTRGGNAITTTITETESNEGVTPEDLVTGAGGVVSLKLAFAVRYLEDIAS